MTENYARVKFWRKRNPEKYRLYERMRAKKPHRKKKHYVKVKKQNVRWSNDSLKTAFRHGDIWEDFEDHLVKNSTGHTKELAKKLGRSWWSIVNRRAILKRNERANIQVS
jgi:hypothetical protein